MHNALNTRPMQLTVNISNNVNINIAHRILPTTDHNRTSFHLHTNVQTNNVQQNEDENDDDSDDGNTDDSQNSTDDDDDDDDDQQLTPTKNKGNNAKQVD